MQEKNNIRLDEYLVIKNYFDSRTKSKQCIERCEVYIDGVNVIKPSFSINLSKEIVVEIKASESFVSLGGYKLQKALKDFNFSVENYVVADIGCSYGGFTDCLLQNKARKVFAVDVTDDILHKSLKDSEKVVFINKNANRSLSSRGNPGHVFCSVAGVAKPH